jgi:hypothetical protein
MRTIGHDIEWARKVHRAHEYLAATKSHFPQYIEELRGYAEGAGVDVADLWVWSLEDEFDHYQDHCTSVITNGGKLILHNEDWDEYTANDLTVIQKTVGDVTIFELNYMTTLGGNSISVNSYGYVQLINVMEHSDWQMGVPRNVVSRFLSETKDPASDLKKLTHIKRSLGYNHNIIDVDGQIWNAEYTSAHQSINRPAAPFVHTNHYLSDLKRYEATDSASTYERFNSATRLVKPVMDHDGLLAISDDVSAGPELSVFNNRTIGRALIDLDRKVARIWLQREADKGWVDYPLAFLQA